MTSGLGRNGPWLQNAWLRVETRLDDGSISPVTLDGAFRPTERALSWITLAEEHPIAFARCDYDVQPHEDRLGRGRRLTLTARQPRRGLTAVREVVLYETHPFALTRVGLTNLRSAPVHIDDFHVFSTPDRGRGKLRVASQSAELRIYRNGWQSWSPTMSFGGSERDVQSSPHVLSPEMPQAAPGRFSSDDVGVLYDPGLQRSLLAGAVTARQFVSQVYVDAPARAVDARNLCDAMPLHPGDTTWSERFAIDLCGHPNAQLARYGDALAQEMGARPIDRTPSGWCSWYYFYTTVTEADVLRNLRALEAHRGDLPIDTVQIDDGYQAAIGDWLITNEKFPRGMQWLAAEIKAAGYTPGLWLAPFLYGEGSRALAEHPDLLVRDAHGKPLVAMENWGHANYALDGSHPAAQSWIEHVFRQVCDGWGYDYVKIDFLFAAAAAGMRHDPGATRVSAYRSALDAVRRGVGPDRFILGCGSLMAPSVGYFDGNRIGPDCAPFWRFQTREQRALSTPAPRGPDDLLSTETALRNTITRSWMHGRLWANDPDCLLVREDRTKLTADEVRTMATVIGLSAGMMLSSDDLDQLTPERRDLIAMLLPPLPRSAVPLDLMRRDMPERFETVFDRDDDPLRLVGVFNFADGERDLMLDLPDGAWHVFELWTATYHGVTRSAITFERVPAHGSRLVALRPATGHPQLVATDAHIGLGALDVSAQTYDAASRELRLRLEPHGRRSRRLWVAGDAPQSCTIHGAETPLQPAGRDAWAVEAEVLKRADVVIRFA